jgi:simple sugar transport system substrate-binding protein
MGIVVKIGGIPWFNAMETGIKERGAELGVDATMIGPTSADPALQVRAIEDLIARNVDIIGVVPNDEAALEPVLSKARAAGIKVISHEGPGLMNVDMNFELASAVNSGETHAELLAEKMAGKGEYAMFVGSLTVPFHNAWADAANAYIAKEYPDMKLIGERYGVAESVDDSRRTALDLMTANPNLGGFLAIGSQGPIGVGRARCQPWSNCVKNQANLAKLGFHSVLFFVIEFRMVKSFLIHATRATFFSFPLAIKRW